jgi:hypothetical protein
MPAKSGMGCMMQKSHLSLLSYRRSYFPNQLVEHTSLKIHYFVKLEEKAIL